MKFDDVLKEIGEFGPYQKRVYFLATAPTMLCAMEALSVIFVFYIPSHRCALPNFPGDTYSALNETHAQLINDTIPWTNGEWDQCHVFSDVNGTTARGQSECGRWVFDQSAFEATAATDFHTVCSHTYERPNSNIIAEAGALTGAFVSGFFSDRFGRRLTFYMGAFVLLAGGLGIAFTTNLLAFNVCRFTVGMARKAVFLNGLLIGVEVVGPSKRTFAAIFIEVMWCFGEVVLVVMAYFFRDWRHLEIALSVPAVLLLFYWWLIPESPRWLASRGRAEEAQQVLEKIAASNNAKLPDLGQADQLVVETEKTLGFWHVFRSREIVSRMVLYFFDLWVITVVYYGLTLNITNLSGDLFTNFALNIVLETLGYLAPIFLAGRLGRKSVLCTSLIVAGAACTGSVIPVIFNAPNWIIVVLSMVGRFCDCVAFAVIYLYATELFPTVVRSSVIGVGVTISRVGNFVAPYLADVGVLMGGRFRHALPLIVMGSPAILVGLLSLFLPETLGTKLPETFEDLEQPGSNHTCACCWRRRKGEKDTKKAEEDKVSVEPLNSNGEC